jgi:hypothetical protein
MKRLTQLSWLIGVLMLSANAIAQEATEETTDPEAETKEEGWGAEAEAETNEEGGATETASESTDTSASSESEESIPEDSEDAEPEADSDEEEEGFLDSWEMFTSGYFRAAFMTSYSKRAPPSDPDGTKETQVSYAPNRLYDAGYNTFKFTRLYEEDWAEIYINVKRPHIQASVCFMGAWYQWVAQKNPGALFTPGLGWIKLDTDFKLGNMTANIALKGGAFLQVYGYMGHYDNYLYARHHQSGETLELTLPFHKKFVLP